MAVTSGFYNSLGQDMRMYNNSQISDLFNLLITDGVFQNFGKSLVAKATSGMEFIIQPGFAWFNSRWVLNDSDMPLVVPAAPIIAGHTRIDVVAIKIDNSNEIRETTIEYVTGTPAVSPVEPTLTDDIDIHWHKICAIRIPANTTSITDANIINKIGTSEAPFVTGILKTIDATELIAQWGAQIDEWNAAKQAEFSAWQTMEQNDFLAWYDRMKDQLTEDAAGRLQTEVDEINTHLGDTDVSHGNVGDLVKILFPVGHEIASSNANFNPNTHWGTIDWEWERITDCVIYAAGDNDTVGQIVGSNTHTLTVAEMAQHRHDIPSLSGTATGGNHRHKMISNQDGGTTGLQENGHVAIFSSTIGAQNYTLTNSYVDANYGLSGASGNLSLSVATNVSNTYYSGSNTPIDMRTRRLNSVVWRRIA